MDQDITRWLKDELGLVQMSESDLNGLMFHPRYGTLCRRFIKFIAESTLCKDKYPNVYAKEEAQSATEDLETARDKLTELEYDLEDDNWASENATEELNFLKAKLKLLEDMREQQTTSLAAFEEIAHRPSVGIERMSRECPNLDYLNDSSLQHVYSNIDTDNMNSVPNNQLATVDANFKNIREEIESTHANITDLFRSINDKKSEMEMRPPMSPIKAKFEDLIALKLPKFEEETLEIDEDKKKLKDINVALSKQIYELDQEVADLKRQYKDKKGYIERQALDAGMDCLAKLEDLKSITKMVS